MSDARPLRRLVGGACTLRVPGAADEPRRAGRGPAATRRDQRRRWPLAAIVVVAVHVGTPGCGPPALPEDVVVGASLPLSGPDAERGRAMERGYRRAVEETAARGGVSLGAGDGRVPLRLELLDDHGEAALAERLADELVGRGAVALLATFGPVRVATQAAAAEHVSRPYVLSTADAPGLPGRRAEWSVGLTVEGSDEARAHALATRLIDAIERAGVTDARAIRLALGRVP